MVHSVKQIRVAILDLNNGFPNQGMRCIREILQKWGDANNYAVHYDEFDVRQKLEVPGLDYDAYISSGGPGSPLESEGSDWDNKYFSWIHAVELWNSSLNNYPKSQYFLYATAFSLRAGIIK